MGLFNQAGFPARNTGNCYFEAHPKLSPWTYFFLSVLYFCVLWVSDERHFKVQNVNKKFAFYLVTIDMKSLLRCDNPIAVAKFNGLMESIVFFLLVMQIT